MIRFWILDYDYLDVTEGEESQSFQGGPIMSDSTWLLEWSRRYYHFGVSIQIPIEACPIVTPLKLSAWSHALRRYPMDDVSRFFLDGLVDGFRIGCSSKPSSLKSARCNMRSASAHPEVVDNYISKEVSEGRVIGPFLAGLVPAAHTSRFGVIPKSGLPNKWRLIIDLSHPKGRSVNDGIPKYLCSMTYIKVDDAINQILRKGRGSLLAKIDVRSAFRLVPVHPADRHLLAMRWRDHIYIDTCLPFGLRSAPKLFNILADLLEWIAKNRGVTCLLHYLDDFLTVGAPLSQECRFNLDILISLCEMLGVPLALEKITGPVTALDFLGILLDTLRMEARLPKEKLERVKLAVKEWLSKKNATKREILSLLGLLQHAAKVVRPGRTFVRRMYCVAGKVKELDFYTRLNREFRSDLRWWHIFLSDWNGVSFLRSPCSEDVVIQTDASGSWGCAAFCENKWLQWQWPSDWVPVPIMAKELVPIVLSCAVWGPVLKRKFVLFQCDNM